MQKIVPHLWFDNQAKQAAEFYVSLFPDSKITSASVIHDTPSGDCDILSFDLLGYSFMSISAGPLFKFNPSISFMVNFNPAIDHDARAKLDALWAGLSEGGEALMPLDKYPFSEHYGWIQDKFGLSWQLFLNNPTDTPRSPIVPSLLFTGEVCGQAEAASDFYISVFPESVRGTISRYPAGMEPDKAGSVMYTDYQLHHQLFASMDSAHPHNFSFNESISFIVNCEDQAQIDFYWDKLSAVPESEQCGWLKDKFGVSWQIVPTDMVTMMSQGTPSQIQQVTQAFLKMKKFDIATLKKAYEKNNSSGI